MSKTIKTRIIEETGTMLAEEELKSRKRTVVILRQRLALEELLVKELEKQLSGDPLCEPQALPESSRLN